MTFLLAQNRLWIVGLGLGLDLVGADIILYGYLKARGKALAALPGPGGPEEVKVTLEFMVDATKWSFRAFWFILAGAALSILGFWPLG